MLINRRYSVLLTVFFLLLFSSCKSGTDKPVETINVSSETADISNEISIVNTDKTPNMITEEIREYKIPESISLCGEIIDLTNRNNLEMFDREFTIAVWDRAQVFMWLKRSGRFFPYFEKRLKDAGLPDDLKYLAVAESSLHTHVKSKSGALGIWQFMKDTARRYGLKVKRGIIDERLCYERSTDAALEYFTDLRKKFDTWKLVMAAYNCGENKLNQAVKTQEENYVGLFLPRETQRYVFRIAAIKYLLENPTKFGYVIDPARMYKPPENDYIEVDFQKMYYISDLVELAGVTYKDFKKLNPQILSSLLPKGKYYLKVPLGYSANYLLAIAALKKQSKNKINDTVTWSYIVQPGDALYSISWETGVSVSKLKKLNRLKNSRIYPGQKLILKR